MGALRFLLGFLVIFLSFLQIHWWFPSENARVDRFSRVSRLIQLESDSPQQYCEGHRVVIALSLLHQVHSTESTVFFVPNHTFWARVPSCSFRRTYFRRNFYSSGTSKSESFMLAWAEPYHVSTPTAENRAESPSNLVVQQPSTRIDRSPAAVSESFRNQWFYLPQVASYLSSPRGKDWADDGSTKVSTPGRLHGPFIEKRMIPWIVWPRSPRKDRNFNI